MPSKNQNNRRKRKLRYSDDGKLGSDATNSCGVVGVSNDGSLFNVNSTRGGNGDGNSLDRSSMVDGGVDLTLESGVVGCEMSVVDSGVGDCEMREVGVGVVGCVVSKVGSGVFGNEMSEISSVVVNNDLSESNIENDNFYYDFENMSDNFSVFSLESSKNSVISYERSKAGRPKKRKGGAGRPKKVSVMNNSSLDIPMGSISNISAVNVRAFLLIDSIDIPVGPVLHSDNRMINMNINVARDYIKEMWSDPNTWLQEDYIYSYLKYLTTRTEKRVVVLDPAYSFVDYQYGDRDPLIPIENCFNYSENYDILFIPICFPGHFGLVIYDRSVRNNHVCLFVDSLPAVDRLFNVRYPGFDIRRIDLIKRAIIDLTPNLNEIDIQISPIPRGDFVEQLDGVNCGFFVCLYAELYLFNNCSLLYPNLNIQKERKRILWNLSHLILSNEIDYVELLLSTPMNVPINESVDVPVNNFVFPFNFEVHNEYHDNCVVNNFPIVDMEPDPPRNLRRSERIKALNKDIVSEVTVESINLNSLYEISSHCKRNHKDVPCADVRAQHVVTFYDSGNFGDAVCYYCSALLLKSEINELHQSKFKRITSSFCCKCGSIFLPPFRPHPTLLKDLTKADTQCSLEFLKKQNIYNSLLAFASVFVGHRQTSLDGGICYMLNGEFVRKMSSMLAGDAGPSFSQLYILDSDTAFQHRVSNIAYGGDRVDPDVLKNLDILLRECHPLANAYKNFHTQYQEKLQNEGPDAIKNFRLVLLEEREVPDDIRANNLHPRQVNLPTEETLFSLHTESDEPPMLKGICITDEQGRIFIFSPHHPLTDTLCYPLLFPCGDDGYHNKIPFARKLTDDDASESNDSDNDNIGFVPIKKRKFISCRDYVKYRLAIRKDEDYHNIWSSGGGLSQKYTLDYNARIDSDNASYLRRPELDLLSTTPESARRWLARDCGAQSIDDFGSIVMFRKNYPGTRPYFQDMFYDATSIMARTRKSENASFMFTFTSNPHWPEIKRNLFHKKQKIVDRFDIICRIYEDKLRHLHYLLNKKNIFGKILGYGESREFQKRIGGPHLHRVFCTDIPAIPINIENLIWAHIPEEPPVEDKSDWANFLRKVRELIKHHQLHDCAEHCKKANGKCKKGFPKPFSNITVLHENKPAEYKRPSPENGGEVLKIKRGKHTIIYDNSRVVPYNPLILVMFECHHNLEFAYGQTDNLKYALKYPFKGSSFSYVRSEATGLIHVDEPLQYARMIYRSPTEAYSRILSYKYAFLSHVVLALTIHLPENQRVCFTRQTANQTLGNIDSGDLPETPLTSYWNLCNKDPTFSILFENMPETYAFNKNTKSWKKLKIDPKNRNRKPRIGRIYTVSPREPEKFALYLLTKHFAGSYETLLNVNGYVCDTFVEAGRLRGLLEDNEVWERTLREGSTYLNPSQMRLLFANILVFGGTEKCVIDGLYLWNMFIDHFYDRRCTEAERPVRIDRALALIEKLLLSQGRNLGEFNLPSPNNPLINNPDRALDAFFFPHNLNDDEMDETIDVSVFDRAQLNQAQQNFFNLIRASVLDPSVNNKLFYISGDGGTGKTFLLNYVIYKLREIRQKVLATASTGIAATNFYSGGMTFHSAFRFGKDVEPGVLPSIPLESYFGRRIIEANVIVIDEITMLNKTVFENVDILCRTLIPQFQDKPFAGKTVIISGDWKQSLPVVRESSAPGAQVAASIQSSDLYRMFEKHRLIQNMRVIPAEIQFKDWLYSIGTGQVGDSVMIPLAMRVNSRQELYNFVFNTGFDAPVNELLKRLILSPTNRIVDLINDEIIDVIDSPVHIYLSRDNPTNENPFAYNLADYDVVQLNRLTPIGMPAHNIKLKVGAIIVLLQNLNTQKGLCNGTRMIVRRLHQDLIEAETISGSSDRGIRIGICRVRNSYKELRPDGVSFERFQFPVRVAFCMTITKAQGQTCERLGIDISDEPFAHGQTYTAFSRCRSGENIRVFAPGKNPDNNGNVSMRNVVARGIRFD
uniref:ATP-dependent DNA helicase n=1 Tax=Meloidogyne enterolobii TaxID=390850 RepID=A0A6V7WNP0_MELEN|nr:unnamed protein product [Meloidogyne enterolobii]